MKFILGQKIGMTQVFKENGQVVPVTRIAAGPCPIVQVKADCKAVQIGFGKKKEFRLSRPMAGHLKGLPPQRWLKDFEFDQGTELKRGDVITVNTFKSGDKVVVVGTAKGKGFAGVVKRHGFKGGPASHGHKDNLRAPGSIGSGGVQRVFKGTRMGGRMGGQSVTVANLEVVEIHPEKNELYLKGAVPGGRNALLEIRAAGELLIEQPMSADDKADDKKESITSVPTEAVSNEAAESEIKPGPELERPPAEVTKQNE